MTLRLLAGISLLSAMACSDTPTAPLRIQAPPLLTLSAQKAEMPTTGAWFDSTQLGHAAFDGQPYTVGLHEQPGICYQRDFFTYKGAPLFVVFDATDRVNQVDVGHSPYTTERFTLSDFANGPLAADSHLWCIPGVAPPPPPIIPPSPPIVPPPPSVTPPVCNAASFSSWWYDYPNESTITEHMVVNPGYDGVVTYMMSWGLPDTFAHVWEVFHTAPPLPQIRLQIVTQTLHVGANTMSVTLASPRQYPAWQMEWGCELGPAMLITGYEFASLDGASGDYR